MIITSHHARVFDGVTQARMRALAEAQLPQEAYGETCVFHQEPAVLLWVHADTGDISPLCREHTNSSLDKAAEEDTEPPVLVPLVIRRRKK